MTALRISTERFMRAALTKCSYLQHLCYTSLTNKNVIYYIIMNHSGQIYSFSC